MAFPWFICFFKRWNRIHHCYVFLETIERQCLLLLTYRHAEVDEEDLSEFLNDGSWKRGYNINRWDTSEISGIPCRTYAIMM